MANKILFKGIDVSNAGQGKIADWSKVAKNVDFAILKICNGYQNQTNAADAQFSTNFAACQKYNIPVGVYVYAYFTTAAKAKEAAQFAVKLLGGKKIDYPIFLDLEEDVVRKLGKTKILAIAKAFCSEVEKAGYQYGTYANKDWFANTLTDKWYDGYIKWVAQYSSSLTYKGTLDIWQYSSKGTVPGINGSVDMNAGQAEDNSFDEMSGQNYCAYHLINNFSVRFVGGNIIEAVFGIAVFTINTIRAL